MEVMHERVAGLDVHKAMIVACVRIMAAGKINRECRTFETTTASLEALLDWLSASGCTHVAMEATGVYWKPVWNILSDGAFELIVANAAHIKNVPGRKTDVNDATWIADLVACGLIRASFVPDEAIQQLRSLLRARKQLTREQTSHIQRIQKTLEEANIKLDSVISDIMGVSGRRMIEAMIAGVRNPHKLAALADRRIKASPKVLYDALHGRLTEHHRFMLELYLAQHDALAKAIGKIDEAVDAAIARMDEEVPDGQATFLPLISLLCSVPGINVLGAMIILAEIGRDMSRFPTAGHLLVWAGMCPSQNESAGKRKSSRLRKGGSLAQDHPRSVRLGGDAKEGQLLRGAIQAAARQARPKEGDLRRRRLDAHRDLPYAEGRDRPSGPRRRSFRPPFERSQSQASRRATRQARIPRRTTARRTGRLNGLPDVQP